MSVCETFLSSVLTHWGRVTHICVSKLTVIGSDNGLSPGRRQAIIWTNAGILLIRPLGTNFSEMLIEILTFIFMKMRLKVSSAKWRPFRLGHNVLTITHKHKNKGYAINCWKQTKSLDFFLIVPCYAINGYRADGLVNWVTRPSGMVWETQCARSSAILVMHVKHFHLCYEKKKQRTSRKIFPIFVLAFCNQISLALPTQL